MSNDLANMVHGLVERALAGRYGARDVVVTSYDPDQHAIKGAIQPGGQGTGWIPLGSVAVGNGWGVAIGATEGQIYKVQFQNNDLNSGKVVGRVYSDQEKPPRVEAGEMLFRHEGGAQMKMDKDKHLTLSQDAGSVVKMHTDGTVAAKPAPGKFAYLGETEDHAGKCAFVVTTAGPSINVKAKFTE